MRCASFKPFWPLALAQQAPQAIIFAALRRFRGPALFRGLRPSSSLGAPFRPSGLTVRRSRPPTASAELRALEVILKIHGYADEGLPIETVVPAELAEITLVASADELRRIAKFLEFCADGMDACGRQWEHEHLADKDRTFQNSPHFVVFNPECGQ